MEKLDDFSNMESDFYDRPEFIDILSNTHFEDHLEDTQDEADEDDLDDL